MRWPRPSVFSFRLYSNPSIQSFAKTRVFTIQDVQQFAEVSGDFNPIHLDGDKAIVHGTFLLSVLSEIMGTRCPGSGTKVVALTAQFVNPCFLQREIKFQVDILNSRKIIDCDLSVVDQTSGKILVKGSAKLVISK